MAYERLLKVALGALVPEVEELQNERVLDLFSGSARSSGRSLCPLVSMAALFLERAVRS